MDYQSGCRSLVDLESEIEQRPARAKTTFDGTNPPLVEKQSRNTTGGMIGALVLLDRVLNLIAPLHLWRGRI
jgi:hypothetical protein